MKLLVTGGGTGGHVFPALEIAKAARNNGHECLYVGSIRGIEGKSCQKESIQFLGLNSRPIGKTFTVNGLFGILRIIRNISYAQKIIRQYKPDVVFSTGGYSASPLIAASKREKVSLVIHEQNVIPGRTHRIASPYAKKKCVVFKETKQYLGEDCIVTGLPMREVLVIQSSRNQKTISNEIAHTLSFGGSQGASVINEAVLTTAHRVLSSGKIWTHVTGPSNYEACARAAERLCLPEGFRIKAYLEAPELAHEFLLADLAVSRSGAGAICELALFGVPTIFIPYAYAYAGHQEANARVIESLGGASIIRQNEFTPERLEHEWIKWSENKDRRMQAVENLRNWVVRDATQQVLNIIEKQVYEN